MEQRVVITGIGAITPVGNKVEETWKNLVEGNCGIDFIKGYDEYNLPVKVAGQIKNFDQSQYELNAGLARRSDKFCVYAMAAASDAMKDSGLKSGENIAPERLGVYVFYTQVLFLFPQNSQKSYILTIQAYNMKKYPP